MRSRFLAATGVSLLALTLYAGAQDASQKTTDKNDDKNKPASDGKPAAEAQDAKPADAPVAKGTSANDPDYVIGTEDVLNINVWREPEMSRSMTVRPDGKISMPLIGEIDAD